MRLLYASDLHGNLAAYDALFEKADALRPDAVVLGGDLLPHPTGVDGADEQLDFLRDALAPKIASRPDLRVMGILGNDDWGVCQAELTKAGVIPLHGRAEALGSDLWIAGCSYVPVTPFWMSDWDRLDYAGWEPMIWPQRIIFSGPDGLHDGAWKEVAGRPSIEDALADLAQQSDPARTIYVVHTPPFESGLDVMNGGVSIGSRALARFIDAHQPPLTLHGHIHESPQITGKTWVRLDKTVSVNMGASLFQLSAGLIEISKEGIDVRPA